jgi:hypothetical protein
VRRFTLFTIIALFVLITVGAILQIATRNSRPPIPGITIVPTASPSP